MCFLNWIVGDNEELVDFYFKWLDFTTNLEYAQ